MRSRTNLILSALAIVLFASAAGAEVEEQILDLSFEDLLATTVTSASKRSQPLNDTATAVFVITAEDIRKSGATNIADALRMVPGLHVAQIDANKWAVTARGYNGRFSNKLLVLMDGRSVYTTSFSGVYWEVQDIMLDDLDRIEIIRGPGSTLWGANAVNGVINIITRNAVDTQDGVVSLATGDVYRFLGGVRAGARLGEGWFARAYAKARHHDTFPRPDGTDAGDDWRMYQTGFRVDSHSEGSDRYSFLANVYRGVFNQEVILPELQPPYASVSPDEAIATGHNAMARWQRTMSPTSEMSLQVYYDHTNRDEEFARERNSQADLEFQHSFAAGAHTIVWGTGHRFTRNIVDGKHFFDLPRASRVYRLFCAFAQDEIALFDGRVALTAGTKFENNEYTGNELQPSLRAMWKVADQHRLWGSASRAVRTPMRAEDEFRVAYVVIPAGTPRNPGPLPVVFVVTGSEDFDSETLAAYELGYRFADQRVSLDMCLFHNEYDNLRTTVLGVPTVMADHVAQPAIFSNAGAASAYGWELAAGVRPSDWSRLSLAYSYMHHESSTPTVGGGDPTPPTHQVSLNSSAQLRDDLHLNLWLRYISEARAANGRGLTAFPIPAFTTLDVRLAWRLGEELELAVAGQNLLEEQHLQYVPESFIMPTEVRRSFSASLNWGF